MGWEGLELGGWVGREIVLDCIPRTLGTSRSKEHITNKSTKKRRNASHCQAGYARLQRLEWVLLCILLPKVAGLDTETLRQELSDRESEMELLNKQLQEQNSLNVELTEKASRLENQLREAQETITEYETLVGLRDQEKRDLEHSLGERDAQLNGLAATESELREIALKNQEIEDMLHNRDSENDELLARLREQNAELESELVDIEGDYKKAMLKGRELESILSVRETEVGELEKRLKARDKRSAELQHEVAELRTRLDDKEAMMVEHEVKCRELANQLEQRKEQNSRLDNEVSRLNSKLEGLHTAHLKDLEMRLTERETGRELLEERLNKKIDENLLLERQVTLLTKRLADTDELRRKEREDKKVLWRHFVRLDEPCAYSLLTSSDNSFQLDLGQSI